MSLKKVKNNLEINGVEYDIWYDPDSGSVQVRTDVGVFGKQGDLIYDSKVNKQNSVFEEAIKKDSKTVNNIKKSKNSDGGKGKQPGFITDSSVKSGFDSIQDRIKEEFKLVKEDYFFGMVDKNRVEFTVGRDFILKNRSEPQNFFVYPIVKGANYTKSFSYKNL